jgi:hypothetical protein
LHNDVFSATQLVGMAKIVNFMLCVCILLQLKIKTKNQALLRVKPLEILGEALC